VGYGKKGGKINTNSNDSSLHIDISVAFKLNSHSCRCSPFVCLVCSFHVLLGGLHLLNAFPPAGRASFFNCPPLFPRFSPIFLALSQPRLEWQFVMSTEARCRSAHRVSCSPHNTLEINSPELAKIVYKIIVTH